jgi:lipoprotein-anchoring transpeptidase ErfK/SrfK
MTKFCHLIWMMTAAVGLVLSASHSYAQQPDRGDEPGLIADDSYELDPEWQKQMVLYRTTEPPGTIIISTAERHLYLVQPGGRALRYGIGVGRDGFQWQGLLNISKKAEWPDWTPPPEMIARQPYLPRFMAGDVSRRHRLSHPRHQPPRYDRHQGLLRLLPPGQYRRRRPL